ncbi:uncharacterized protein LOC130664008 [Microplitis mediator]|uniref:uncharacterized protein LOC130664008 n=1 Tax=Microplitis mediator TaxID=375433 RepID=UPI00255760FA|nr:uncharacterized protein LOC130664008 [Microplitis mediator]
MILPIAIVIISQSFGIQGAVNIVFEDITCLTYSEEYFTEPDTFISDQNELVVNISLVKTLPMEAQGSFKLTGASMGEYVVDTGLAVQMDLCDVFEEPIITGRLFGALGFSADNCPPEIGVYGSDGYAMPTDTFPDEFPPNKYLVEMKITYEEKPLLVLHIFVYIQ